MSPSICEAIEQRLVLRFVYEGRSRVVEPHCHGVSKAHNEVLRAFQIGGQSESGEEVGWKLFNVGKIEQLVVSGEVFTGTRRGYTPRDSQMTSICCAL